MSFTPLPTTFTDLSGVLDPAQSRNLELGVGDGRFQAAAAVCGLRLWGLDLVPPVRGTTADFVGDAFAPPVSSCSLDLLVASNLVRHLLAVGGNLNFLDRWLALLKPGGSLFIFEDEPAAGSGPAGNYRDLQEFLRRLTPETRGPLLPLADFLALSGREFPAVAWDKGMVRNQYRLDSVAVLEFLGAGPLWQAIAEKGLEPGQYWWTRTIAD